MSCEPHERASDTLSDPECIDPLDATADVAHSASLPRIKRDPTWSPVVSVERATFAEVPVLVVIHRLTYAPGDELMIGRIVIPLEKGTLYLSALRRAHETGVRESVLSIINSSSSPDGAGAVSQAEIDSPALDEKYPDHPLSAIRRALRWALTTSLPITVMAPLPLECDERIELPQSGCSIQPPPRFRLCPGLAAAMDPSLTPFVRATVPLDDSYLFDVWQVPSVRITGNDALPKLRRVAEEHFRGWGREGEPPVEIESGAFVMPGGRPGVTTFVRVCVNGTPNHAVANWFTDHDGTVFRVCARGAVSRSRNELMKVVHDSVATWKRLLPTHPLRSPWWKLFSA